jgi:tetratricopeptide (TPR) repeat protein
LKVWGEALASEWAAKQGQTMAELHAHLAAVYVELERWEEAMQEYLSAARLDDSNPDYFLAAGKIHQRQGRKTDAAELWRSIIQKHPQHAEAHYQLGLVNEQEGDLSTAWEHFKAAISAAPANTDYRAHLAQSYYHSELYYQAIREWEAILQQHPDDVVTQLKLARVYQQINRQDKAHAYYAAVLKIQPDNSEALGALEISGQGEDKKGK